MKEKADNETVKPDMFLDCIGLFCPMPMFETIKEMEKMEKGQVLEIATSDPAAARDIPHWAKKTGHQFLKFWKEGEHHHFLIRKMTD